MVSRRTAAAACAALFAFVSKQALAHDTWLSLAPSPAPGLMAFALSTGDRFPLPESGHPLDGVVRSGCVDATGQQAQLRPRETTPNALLLRVRMQAPPALACWVETRPRLAELDPAAVDTYLHDIRAPRAIVDQWQALRRQGVAWRETYVKHARIEKVEPHRLQDGGLDAVRRPLNQGLEIVPLGSAPTRVRTELRFQLLDDGKPVSGLAVQLVSERSPLGIWKQTDERGQLSYAFPFPGRWLLRATRLQAPAAGSAEWRSRFSTLLLEAS